MSAQSKKKRHTKEEVYPVVKEWLKTGERKKDLCQRHGLPVYVLDYWLRKYRGEKSTPPISPSNFVPITIKSPSSPYPTSDQIEISYSDGTTLRLPVNFSMAQLRSLLPLFSSADV